jgi:hypothetical protein
MIAKLTDRAVSQIAGPRFRRRTSVDGAVSSVAGFGRIVAMTFPDLSAVATSRRASRERRPRTPPSI